MSKRILVLGAGFAGMWSALAAARLVDASATPGTSADVVMVAPEPTLTIRPRLYEANSATMATPLGPLLEATGVRFVHGTVVGIRTEANEVDITDAVNARSSLSYDSLVLATGSRLHRPDIPGLIEHTFSIDQLEEAAAFEAHCARLADMPPTPARNTAVVVGGGFTGIEAACELPARLKASLGCDATVIVIERANEIGPDLGPGPRPVITQALRELGVTLRLGVSVTMISGDGVQLSSGETIEAKTVLWTAGLRASPLTQNVPGKRDALGRLRVDDHLRAPQTRNVFAAGDTACAITDEDGHVTLMSCQHAMPLGRFAGHNAAALVLHQPMLRYRQPRYGTGLDLGPWGAVQTIGWERKIISTGAAAKSRKQFVNCELIYPPAPNRAAAFAAAEPKVLVPT